jgi:trypsin
MPENLNPESIPRARSLLVGATGVTIFILLAVPGLTVAHGGRAAARRSTPRSSSHVAIGHPIRHEQSSPPRRGTKVRVAIVGGSAAPAGRFPWLAYVYDNLGNGTAGVCSGTVVSSNLVLTAGHCAEDASKGTIEPASGFAVVTGRIDSSDTASGQVSTVSQVLPYPGYRPADAYGDAALLELTTPTSAPAVPLATASDLGLLSAGTSGLIAGWGLLSGTDADLPTALHWASTVVQAAQYCTTKYGPSIDPNSELCAVGAPSLSTGTCQGDSGGPLIAFRTDGTPVEIGVTSRGPSGCVTNEPDIFTRVDLLSSWEAAQAASLAPPPPAAPPPAGSPPAALPATTSTPTTAPPRVSPAQPSLQRMNETAAKSYVRQTLRGVFGNRFKPGDQLTTSCSRASATRFACSTTWSHAPNDYFGTVTVLYEINNNQQAWTDHYAIRWVTDRCYLHSSHPRRCKVYTARGTY